LRPTWDETWLSFAEVISRRTLCPGEPGRPPAGAVVVSKDNRASQPGYAGPSRFTETRNVTDCRAFCHRRRKPIEDRDPAYLDCVSVHAEQNALVLADMARMAGGTIYVTREPCHVCYKLILNSGLNRLVYWDQHDKPRIELLG
jgi:dCMP deaminase